MEVKRGSGENPSSARHERQGSDGCKIYCCSFCYRFEVPSYESWLWHLGSREHQLSINKSGASSQWRRDDIRSRCVTVYGVKGLTSREILEYLGHWGEVEDFQYFFLEEGKSGLCNYCLCLYRDLESAQACIKIGNHEFKGKKLEIVARRDVPFPRDPARDEERSKRRMNQGGMGWDYKRRRYEDNEEDMKSRKEDKKKSKRDDVVM
ncbi:hypothetical protein Ocin01_12607 [Orchesella cincta]|uniref:RRM domain-containing protein n=1 Tax=Orchesella cincta TaxID=48709 RepID=A0A1D2MLY4_ORCCI|nr:hypothetical protein Ocin01_12607 [Orchesella cincta]